MVEFAVRSLQVRAILFAQSPDQASRTSSNLRRDPLKGFWFFLFLSEELRQVDLRTVDRFPFLLFPTGEMRRLGVRNFPRKTDT